MFDENVPNRSSSPLQFDLSPAQMRVPAMRSLVSPATIINESDSESLGCLSSRSSGSEMSSLDSSVHLDMSVNHEDEFLARIADAPAPMVTEKPSGPSGSTRRFMSMSANIFLGRKSPLVDDEDEVGPAMAAPVKKASPVKKNLFSAITEDEDELMSEPAVPFVVSEVQQFRWERSASMVELTMGGGGGGGGGSSFAMPSAAAAPAPNK